MLSTWEPVEGDGVDRFWESGKVVASDRLRERGDAGDLLVDELLAPSEFCLEVGEGSRGIGDEF